MDLGINSARWCKLLDNLDNRSRTQLLYICTMVDKSQHTHHLSVSGQWAWLHAPQSYWQLSEHLQLPIISAPTCGTLLATVNGRPSVKASLTAPTKGSSSMLFQIGGALALLSIANLVGQSWKHWCWLRHRQCRRRQLRWQSRPRQGLLQTGPTRITQGEAAQERGQGPIEINRLVSVWTSVLL